MAQVVAPTTLQISSRRALLLRRLQLRWLLPRRHGSLSTSWGVLRAKQVQRPDGRCSVKPEADDLQRLAPQTLQIVVFRYVPPAGASQALPPAKRTAAEAQIGSAHADSQAEAREKK